MAYFWLIASIALVISLTAPIFLRPVLTRLNVLDVPNERSSHSTPVLRGGGLGPLLAFVVALIVLMGSISGAGRLQVGTIGAVALAAGVLGWVEDLKGIRVALRAGLQIVIGVGAVLVLSVGVDVEWWLAALCVLAIAGYINVANFMDGVNGISSLHGIAVGAAYALLGVLFDEVWLVGAGVAIAASFAGFLPWNLRGGMFLGDVGSYLLGAAISVTAVAAVLAGVPVVVICGPILIYLADTGFTLFRRVIRGEPWSEAHRLHVYQRLTDVGLSHVSVSTIVFVFSMGALASGLISVYGGAFWGTAISLALYLGISSLYISSPGILAFVAQKRSKVR